MEAIITSVAGISVSVAAYAFKVGGLKWKQKTFYKIAKFILVKIFNEFKDGERIKVLQKILIEKFNSKSMKELKLFLIELKEIEELQKQYNHDDFFEKNKVKIVNDIVNLKEYFNKKLLIEEFSLFVFCNVYDTKVDDAFYREFQFELLEDFALNENVSALKLRNIFAEIYNKSNKLNKNNFELLNKKFLDNRQELIDIVGDLKKQIKTGGKHIGRGLDMINENLNMLSFDTEMFNVNLNKRVKLNEEINEKKSKKSIIENKIQEETVTTIRRMGSISVRLAENVSLF